MCYCYQKLENLVFDPFFVPSLSWASDRLRDSISANESLRTIRTKRGPRRRSRTKFSASQPAPRSLPDPLLELVGLANLRYQMCLFGSIVFDKRVPHNPSLTSANNLLYVVLNCTALSSICFILGMVVYFCSRPVIFANNPALKKHCGWINEEVSGK